MGHSTLCSQEIPDRAGRVWPGNCYPISRGRIDPRKKGPRQVNMVAYSVLKRQQFAGFAGFGSCFADAAGRFQTNKVWIDEN